MKKQWISLALAFCCLGAFCGCNRGNTPKPEHLGLYVAEDGTMMKDGAPYYGIGVNYYSMLNGCKTGAKYDTTKALASLETLASYDVRVIRFNLGFYNAREWFDFINHAELQEKHLTALDQLVKKAEELGIGLIPSFAWNPPAISDALDEPCNTAFAREDTRTMTWFLAFTKRVVARYAESPAIYAWEYGNEQNLSSSIKEEYREEASPLPAWSERAKRTDADYLTYETHEKSLALFAEAVHQSDPYHRMIGSGDAAQRPYIWHWVQGEDAARDSLEQFEEILDMTVPGYMSAISVHEYAHSDSGTPNHAEAWLDGTHTFESNDFVDYFQKYLQESVRTKKAVYMGETGYLSTMPGTRWDWNRKDEDHSIKVTDAILKAAYETDFPLTLLWTYDDRTIYKPENHTLHDGGTEHSWNENFAKGKAYLEAIKKYNGLIDEKHTATE